MWTTVELRELRDHGRLGAVAVALLLGRTVSSVKSAASRGGISLRQPGSRRGLVLGQPRCCSLRADMRGDLVSGRVSAEAVAARVKLDREAALCPVCARREIASRGNGLCRVCYLQKLTEAHLQALEEIDAQRSLWASRQCLKRARDAQAAAGC